MRVLTRVHAYKVSRKLVNEVPRRVLEAVAREEGRREAQVVNELIRRLPKTVEPETISDWVDETLGWLIVRGDVEREPRGVYRCVPPYLVEASGVPNDAGLRLHGNPRAEPDLLKILKTLDARLVHGEAQHYSRSKRDDDEQPDLGVVERYIALNQADQFAAAQMCESNGYAVLRPAELVSTLPRKDDVVTPAVQDLTILEGRPPGLWEAYDPTANRAERWNPAEDWQSDEARLVRWRSSDGWEGNRSARIYFHSGGGRVAELGAEMAALWQLYLDDLSWNARTMWWNRNRLWVPNMLPTATLRWLELVAGLRARFAGAWLRLAMDENAAGLARTTLSETLGLKFRRGNPPREYHRRGGRHGRRGR
jgi:hypothetical protein